MKLGKSNLHNIAKLRPDFIKRRRISSYDKKGGNLDWIDIKAGETVVIGGIKGAGCITHIWCTCMCVSKYSLRNAIIRMYWDGELDDKPSVETPIGDFLVLDMRKEKYLSLPLFK